MKKILNIILCALVAVSLFTVSVSAVEATPLGGAGKTADFSEDYTHLTFEEQTYTIIDTANLDYDDFYYGDDRDSVNVNLTEQQKENVAALELDVSKNKLIIEAEYTLSTGVSMFVTYIDDNYFEQYNKASNGETEDVFVYFGYPDNNQFETTLTRLKENKTSIKIDYMNPESFTVRIAIDEKLKNKVYVIVGELILVDDIYYYLDYKDAGIKNVEEAYSLFEEGKTYTVYEITDPDTVWGLENCYNLFNEDLAFVNDEEIAEKLVDTLATIVFGVLPLVVLVLTIIFGIRFKEKYRKLFFTLGVFAIAEIIVFAILSVLLG